MILRGFEDAAKEGDGERLFEIYKLLLLIYKPNHHTKYAYAAVLYLTKISAILPEFESHRMQWNRFVNSHGGKGCNISLDLKKEHLNKLLKTMWRVLRPNLSETTAARLACTLDSVKFILKSIDHDCKLSNRAAQRSVAKKEEAVQQITADLVSIKAFRYTRGREGYPSFPKFNPNLLSALDFRDLHK